MSYESRVAVSFYKEIAPINEEHKVFLVQHMETGKIFVKKILSVYSSEIYRRLQDAHIVGIPQIYCVHEEGNELTVIEEHISGSTLEEIIGKNGPLNENAITAYLVELCTILDKLHSFNPPIIHRDIKPSNIIITPDNHVVLLDLNAARTDVAKAEDTVLLGTKGYAAPEQYGFGSSGIQTDVYAIGMLMNTLLWGSFNHDIFPDSPLTAIIRKCTRIDPKDRYSSVSEVAKDLKITLAASQSKTISSRHKILPPGFRSGILWHMLIAVPVYALILDLSLTLTPKNTYGFTLYFERAICLLILLSIVACITNYCNIQRFMPLCSNKNIFLKVLGIFILCTCFTFFLFMFMTCIETILPK